MRHLFGAVTVTPVVACLSGLFLMGTPAFAQIELSGSYASVLHEDYLERGPGSPLGDFTGMPLSDEGRAQALLYMSNLPSTVERQCLALSPWSNLFRPIGLLIRSEHDKLGQVIGWTLVGDFLRDTITIWIDGRPHPSPNAYRPASGFTTGTWQGDTLVARMTHVKTAWIRRGNGIPGSDESTFTVYLSRHDDLLTITAVQHDPIYLTEPHVVSRVWQFDPRGSQPDRSICNTANEVPTLEDTGVVPHYLPGQNPEKDYMVRTYNIPEEAAMGYSHTLYPSIARRSGRRTSRRQRASGTVAGGSSVKACQARRLTLRATIAASPGGRGRRKRAEPSENLAAPHLERLVFGFGCHSSFNCWKMAAIVFSFWVGGAYRHRWARFLAVARGRTAGCGERRRPVVSAVPITAKERIVVLTCAQGSLKTLSKNTTASAATLR